MLNPLIVRLSFLMNGIPVVTASFTFALSFCHSSVKTASIHYGTYLSYILLDVQLNSQGMK